MKKITLILTMLFIAAFSWQNIAQTIVIGTGTADSNGNDSDPVDGYFEAFKYQVVYTAAELSASLTPYDEITALGFSVSEDYGGGDLLGYTIKMGHTTVSNSASHDTSSTMEVKAAHDYDPTATVAGVFDMITFDTNFVWNGVDNVLIEICTDGSNPYTLPRGGVRTTLLTDGSRRYRSDSTTACDKNTSTSNPERPNIQFNYIDGTPPACLAVSSITMTAIIPTDVTLGWTENNTVAATAWEYVIQAPGTGEPLGSGTAANANPFTDMSLTAETDYEVYVRADCGASDYSAWTGPVTFTTPCAVVDPSTAYTQDFTTFAPNCWDQATDGDLVSGPTGFGSSDWASEEFAHVGTGLGAVNINLYNSGRSDWILSPEFDLSAGGYELKLDVALTEYNSTNATTFGSDDQVQLLYTEDGGATWSNLQTWAAGSEPATAGETVTIMLASTANSVQFALWGTDGAIVDGQDNDFHIDNFIVQISPVCEDPTALAVSDETATGATFAWTENNTTAATEWDLYIVPAGDPAPTMASTPTVDDATDAVATVWTGGAIGTSYDAYVRADCAADNTFTSAWVGPVSFTTLCATITPDYTQDFTTFTPNCWDQATNGNPASGPTGFGSSDWASEEFAHVGTGLGAVNINLYTNNRSDWILSPEFDLSAGGYELVFDVALTGYNNTSAATFGSDDQVQLLYTEDGTTWTNLQTWAVGSEPSNTGETIIIPLTPTGTTVQFGFWGSDGTVNDSEDVDFHLDNFIVRTPPACYDPSDLTATGITATDATFAWTENVLNIPAATTWDLYIVPTGDAAPTVATTPTTGMDDVTDNAATTWTGGTTNTSYDAYVRADCDSDNVGVSTWFGPVTFQTECTAFTAPFIEAFENAGTLPNCWKMTGGEDWEFSNDVTTPGHIGNDDVVGNTSASGGYFAWVDDSGTGTNDVTLMSPFIDTTLLTEPALSFYLLSHNEGNANATLIVEVYDGSAWNLVGTYNSNTADWEKIIVPLNGLAIIGNIQVRFVVADSGSFYDDIAIDDVSINEVPSCYVSSDLTATGITATDATFAWTENVLNIPAATTWDLYIVPTGDAAPTVATTPTTGMDDVTDNAATTWVGGTASLTYDAYVRSDCDSDNVGVSAWFGPYTFSMACNAFGDFTENFDTTADGELTNCWSSIVNSADSNARVTVEDASGTAFSGNNKVELYNGNDENSVILLITPELTDLLSATHRIRFMARGNQTDPALIIGTMSDATDVATFTPMAGVALTDTYMEYSVLFDGTYPAGHKYIAFMHGNDGTDTTDFQTLRIDDFAWEPIPSCLEVSDIVLSGITATNVTMAWTENNTTTPATAWQYVIQAPGTGEPTGSGAAANANPFTDMSLTAETDYEVYVRADCGGSDFSAWTGPVTFTTPCVVMTPYYSEDFTTFVPNCWTNNTISGFPSWNGSNFGNTGTDAGAKINLYTGNTDAELLTPSFDLSAGGYELLIDVAVTDWNNPNSGTMGSDDAVELSYTEDSGTTWNSITIWNVGNQPATTGETFTVALTSTAANVQFKVQATTGPVDDLEDYDFHIDNFIVRIPPSCFEPSALTATGLTTTDATFSWTENPLNTTAATNWDLYIVPSGDAAPTTASTPSAGMNDVTNNAATTWTAGATNTSYDAYVRADCGADNTVVSIWFGPVTFQTECTTFTAPFIENFENTGALPDCWKMTGGEDWEFSNDVTAPGHVGNDGVVGNTSASGGYFAWVDDSGTGTNDVTLMSPFINALSLTEPTLYFNLLSHNEGNSNATLTVEVYDGTIWNLVGTYNSNTADWEEVIVSLHSLTITGNIQVRFVVADSGQFYDDIAIDDVSINEAPSCFTPTDLTVSNIDATAGTVDLGWTDNNGTAPANGWEYEIVDVTASGVVTGTGIATATNPVTVGILTTGNQYEFLVRAICGAGDESAWSTAFSWTQIDAPGCASNPTPAHQATDVVVGLITFSWDAPTTGLADSYNVYGGTDPLALALVTNVTATTANLTLNEFGTTLYWQVVPVNVNGETTGCAIWEFTMEQPYTDGCSAYSSSPGTAIVDGTPVDDIITVSTGTPTFVVDDLDVIVNIPHTYVGDLTITLTSPAGTAVVIYDESCGGNENLNITFDDDGVAVVCATPVSGVYLPANALSAFNGEVFDGDWTLNVTDAFVGDDGTLVQWCLMPTLGDPAAITDLDAVGFNFYPNPVSKELTMTANETIKSVTIFNMLGQEVKTIRPSTLEATIDMSTLATGTYFVKAHVGESVGTFKVVKQ